MVGYISLTPRPDNGLRSLGTIEDLAAGARRATASQEVIIADPDFPQEQAVELVDQCHQRGVTVRVAPSTMEILVHRAEFVPGTLGAAVRAAPAGLRGLRLRASSARSTSSARCSCSSCSARCCWPDRARGAASPRAARCSTAPIRPGIGGVPFACFKFRTMRTDADQLQADLESLNEASGALFKIRHDPRLTPVGRFLRRFSLDELPQLVQRAARARCRWSGRGRCRSATSSSLEDWHKKRYLVLPGHHRPVAGLRPLGARLRRPRAARLPLPRALVGLPRPDDPAQDHARGVLAPRRVLAGPHPDRFASSRSVPGPTNGSSSA